VIFAHEQAEDWPMPLTSGDREEVREAIARQGFAIDLPQLLTEDGAFVYTRAGNQSSSSGTSAAPQP